MEQLILVRPLETHAAAARAYIEEHRRAGERELHGAALLEQKPYADWLAQVRANADPATADASWVPSSTFFALREADGALVGVIDIRHRLNDFLRDYGGHIGYGVRPSERRKGYAGQMLALALAYARRELGLAEVLLCCYKDNEASRRTILGGGVSQPPIIRTRLKQPPPACFCVVVG